MIKKRLAEIEARRLEIRTSLETDKNADLDALENEVRELELEEKQLERRQALLGQAEAISTGEAEARNLGTVNDILAPVAEKRSEKVNVEERGKKLMRAHREE